MVFCSWFTLDAISPFCRKSFGAAYYFLTFLDDYLKETWICFFTFKSECFTNFQYFHTAMETYAGKKIFTLRSDNGGKFTSWEFTNNCMKYGIQCRYLQPHTPQYNGVVERKNKRLLNIVRCFLDNGDLPRQLWIEVIQAACIIMNFYSSKS